MITHFANGVYCYTRDGYRSRATENFARLFELSAHVRCLASGMQRKPVKTRLFFQKTRKTASEEFGRRQKISFAPHSEFSAFSNFKEQFGAFPVSDGEGARLKKSRGSRKSRKLLCIGSRVPLEKERGRGSLERNPFFRLSETEQRTAIGLSSPFRASPPKSIIFSKFSQPATEVVNWLELCPKIPKFVQICGLGNHTFQLFPIFLFVLASESRFSVKIFPCFFGFLLYFLKNTDFMVSKTINLTEFVV